MRRDYGIDLLKAVAMMMVVVVHHIMMASGAEHAYSGIDNMILQTFHSWCYCAVNCFVMATGYIMCQKDWRWQRIFRLWRQVVGYSLVLLAIGYFVLPNSSLTLRDVLYAVCPISTNRYWFVTQYFALFFTMPFLNILVRNMSEQESRKLVIGGAVLLTVIPFVSGSDLFVLKWGYDFAWFVYLYLVGAHLSKYGLQSLLNGMSLSGPMLVLSLIVFSAMAGSSVLVGEYSTARFGVGARVGELSYSYASPLILAEAICMIVIFSRINIKSKVAAKLTSAIAPGIFIVFVVHSNQIFRRMVGWNELFVRLSNLNVYSNIALTVLAATCIFLTVVLVDWGRRCLLSK